MLNVGGNKKKPYNQLRTFPDMNYKIQIQDNDLIGVMNGNLEDMIFSILKQQIRYLVKHIYFKGEFIRDSSNEITSLIIMKYGTRVHLNKL